MSMQFTIVQLLMQWDLNYLNRYQYGKDVAALYNSHRISYVEFLIFKNIELEN